MNNKNPKQQLATAAVSQTQAELIRGFREQSFLNPVVPLGYPPPQTSRYVEIGPTVQDYFYAKHHRGAFGRFYPLHVLARY